MLINGERALAYIVKVDDVIPIEGADNIELALVGGWNIIIKKQELKPGDKAVFFEIDSKVPENDERFKFLESKHYRIKTMKLNKFKVWSEGLLLPLSEFPELGDPEINTDVTEKLGVTYAVEEDKERKKPENIENNTKAIIAAHKKIFSLPPIAWLMRYKWSRKTLLFLFGSKKNKPYAFPKFISKTDEERCENMPWILGKDEEYICTEKLDGTSCTYSLEKVKPTEVFGVSFGNKYIFHVEVEKSPDNPFEYYVCSRNLRIRDEEQKTYHDKNIYWELENKYNIHEHLQEYLDKNPGENWVCIQGEGVGFVQGNPLKLKEDDLYLFNFITSKRGRFPSLEGKAIAEAWGMKWVPILGTTKIPATMDELKDLADGKSAVNPDVMREGIVYRSIDGQKSFKNVSRAYLLSLGKKAKKEPQEAA